MKPSSKPLIPIGVIKRKGEEVNFDEEKEKKQKLETKVEIIEKGISKEDLGIIDEEIPNQIKEEEIKARKLAIPESQLDLLLKKILRPNFEMIDLMEKETKRINHEISIPPPPEEIRELNNMSYLQIGYLIKRMVEVFGSNSYTSEIKSITKVSDTITQKGSCKLTYTCWMKVTVRNLYLESFSSEDIGTGDGIGDYSKAVDTGIKAARTDAFKRCVKDFGITFGSLLYSTDQIKKMKKENKEKKEKK